MSKQCYNFIFASRQFLFVGGLAIILAISATCVQAQNFGLGDAGSQNFGVLDVSGSYNESGGSVDGNVGISSAGGGNCNLNRPATINGQIITDTGVTCNNAGVPVTGGITVNDTLINTAVADASSASAANASLTPTTTVPGGAINNNNQNLTITGTTGRNVVDVSGLNLNNSTLTIDAPAGSTFVLNDKGSFNLNDSSIVLEGGITGNDVLYNVVGDQGVNLSGGGNSNVVDGVLLADQCNVNINSGQVNGEVIGRQVNIADGRVIDNYTPSTVPEPNALTISVMGACIVSLMLVVGKFRPSHDHGGLAI